MLYLRSAETLLAHSARHSRGPELAADLTAETWAAALAGRRRLGMERLVLDDEDILRIEALGEAAAGALVELLPSDQRRAVRAHVVDELPYGALAAELNTSEAVVRKRVSRGLTAVRDELGPRP